LKCYFYSSSIWNRCNKLLPPYMVFGFIEKGSTVETEKFSSDKVIYVNLSCRPLSIFSVNFLTGVNPHCLMGARLFFCPTLPNPSCFILINWITIKSKVSHQIADFKGS
jgi:hypothetical protein